MLHNWAWESSIHDVKKLREKGWESRNKDGKMFEKYRQDLGYFQGLASMIAK
jgi:hypothetical protein